MSSFLELDILTFLRLLVIGMGKLGGRELNVSSDIDRKSVV